MALKAHCDGCDRVLAFSACANLKTGRTARVRDGVTCDVIVRIERVEHLCHACRKGILNDAIESAIIGEWWDPK